MTTRECSETIRRQLASGAKPAGVWGIFLGFVETLSGEELAANAVELDTLAGLFPDEVRYVPTEAYCEMTELPGDSREGPEWKFERFLPEPGPLFRFARYAFYSFDNGIAPWLQFAGRAQIRHWYFDGLRYRPADELRQVFTEDYFRNSSGATLRWIDADKEDHRALFAATPFWQHWQTLRFEWLRSDDFLASARWIHLLAGSAIRRFGMQSCTVGEAGYRELAGNSFMTQLEELELLNVNFGNHECKLLMYGRFQPRRLKRLKLEDCILSSGKPEVDGETFVAFIQSAFFSCLEDFENHYHTIGPEGMAALTRSPSRMTMRHLSLHNSRLGDAGLKILFENAWPNLREIHISYDTFSAGAIAMVKASPLFAQCPEVAVFPMEGEHIYKTQKKFS